MTPRKTPSLGYVAEPQNKNGSVVQILAYRPDGSVLPAPRIEGWKDWGGLFGAYEYGYKREQGLAYLRWLNGGSPKGFEPKFI